MMSSFNHPKLHQVHLRSDLSFNDINSINDPTVKIFGPKWAEGAVRLLSKHIPSSLDIAVTDKTGKQLETTLDGDLNLRHLVVLARNQSYEVSGAIQANLAHPAISRSLLHSIKDLVRQLVIIGFEKYHKHNIILVDHIPLGFDQPYGSGRLVLNKPNIPQAILDDFIYKNVVGEEMSREDWYRRHHIVDTDRYLQIVSDDNRVQYLDTNAYKKFVEKDFLLICLAINTLQVDRVILRYSKTCKDVLLTLFSTGIYQGIRSLINSERNSKIIGFEFPLLPRSSLIEDVCKEHGFHCVFRETDQMFLGKNYTLAVTNHASNHAMIGNNFKECTEGNLVIRLDNRAKGFIPLVNSGIGEVFVSLDDPLDQMYHGAQARDSLPSGSPEPEQNDNNIVQTEGTNVVHAEREHQASSNSPRSTHQQGTDQDEQIISEAEVTRQSTIGPSTKPDISSQSSGSFSSQSQQPSSCANVEQARPFQNIETREHEMCEVNDLVVELRKDQWIGDIGHKKYQDDHVRIFGPKWVKEGLNYFNDILKTRQIKVIDRSGRMCSKTLSQDLSLKDLVILSRNEQANTTGKIHRQLYHGHLDKASILSLKDLVRQLVIVGPDLTTHYGGYGRDAPVRQVEKVILVDLIGLQFQRPNNTGRLVLINDKLPKGPLDDLIFSNVVGEQKRCVSDVQGDTSGRYIDRHAHYFDTYAYEKFVEHDFVLVCLALGRVSPAQGDGIKLKFLKYGTGFFAGPFAKILEEHIMNGVLRGMRRVLPRARQWVRALEFPYYHFDPRVDDLCRSYDIECCFTTDDALKRTDDRYAMCTTNCSDPHSVTGNEMQYSSVDAAIAENLLSKGSKFSPIINTAMSEELIDLCIDDPTPHCVANDLTLMASGQEMCEKELAKCNLIETDL